jgi:hypothetical protein
MKKDRFLLGILIFIGLLVVIAIAMFFSGGGQPDYLTGDSPEATVHNFALAVSKNELVRAYEYLAEGEDKPDEADFRRHFTQNDPLRNIGLRVGDTELIGEQAIVRLTVVRGSNGLFDSGYDSEDSAVLVQQDGVWKIIHMPYPFWDFNWLGKAPRPN